MMRQFVMVASSALIMLSVAGTAHSQTQGGAAVNIGTLGIGFDGAVQVAQRANARVGVNFFNFNHDFDNDGTTLAAHLKLRSVTAQLDWTP